MDNRPSLAQFIHKETETFLQEATGPFDKQLLIDRVLRIPAIDELRLELGSYLWFDAEKVLLEAVSLKVHQHLQHTRDSSGMRVCEAVNSGGVWFWYPIKALTMPMLNQLIRHIDQRMVDMKAKGDFYRHVRDLMVEHKAERVSDVLPMIAAERRQKVA